MDFKNFFSRYNPDIYSCNAIILDAIFLKWFLAHSIDQDCWMMDKIKFIFNQFFVQRKRGFYDLSTLYKAFNYFE